MQDRVETSVNTLRTHCLAEQREPGPRRWRGEGKAFPAPARVLHVLPARVPHATPEKISPRFQNCCRSHGQTSSQGHAGARGCDQWVWMPQLKPEHAPPHLGIRWPRASGHGLPGSGICPECLCAWDTEPYTAAEWTLTPMSPIGQEDRAPPGWSASRGWR